MGDSNQADDNVTGVAIGLKQSFTLLRGVVAVIEHSLFLEHMAAISVLAGRTTGILEQETVASSSWNPGRIMGHKWDGEMIFQLNGEGGQPN